MSYGMDGWNHDNDLVRRKDVMDSLVKEYNRRFSLGERSGLRLAWIEKAVNDVDVAQQGKTRLPEEDATKGATSDLISRAEAIDDLHGKDPSQIWDTADIEVWVNALPSAQPEQECEKCIFKPFKQFQPERKTGRWIPHEDEDGEHYGDKCSECGEWYVMPYGKTRFCPNCGAEMEVSES